MSSFFADLFSISLLVEDFTPSDLDDSMFADFEGRSLEDDDEDDDEDLDDRDDDLDLFLLRPLSFPEESTLVCKDGFELPGLLGKGTLDSCTGSSLVGPEPSLRGGGRGIDGSISVCVGNKDGASDIVGIAGGSGGGGGPGVASVFE